MTDSLIEICVFVPSAKAKVLFDGIERMEHNVQSSGDGRILLPLYTV